jgi:hypothetical protein
VQAYVSKREIVYEIDQLGKSNNAAVRVQFQNESLSNLKIKVKLKEHQDTIIVDMTFKDKSSIFPTDIAIRRWEKNMSAIDFELEDQSNDSFLDEDEMFLYSKIKYDLTVRAMKDVFLELI